jgi:hypothetical protein
MSDVVAKTIGQFSDRSFGQAPRWIVDPDHPLPPGITVNQLYALSNCSGFTCVDAYLVSGSGAYPTNVIWGWEVYGSYTDVRVNEGSILCVYNT